MAKQPKSPKPFKIAKIKMVKGYMKKDGTFISPYFKGL
jgi:hypothetical protein